MSPRVGKRKNTNPYRERLQLTPNGCAREPSAVQSARLRDFYCQFDSHTLPPKSRESADLTRRASGFRSILALVLAPSWPQKSWPKTPSFAASQVREATSAKRSLFREAQRTTSSPGLAG